MPTATFNILGEPTPLQMPEGSRFFEYSKTPADVDGRWYFRYRDKNKCDGEGGVYKTWDVIFLFCEPDLSTFLMCMAAEAHFQDLAEICKAERYAILNRINPPEDVRRCKDLNKMLPDLNKAAEAWRKVRMKLEARG